MAAAVAEHAVVGAAAVSGKLASAAFTAIMFGSFNPTYKKENQKRMRYIQSKYARAYAGGIYWDNFIGVRIMMLLYFSRNC